MAKIELGSQDSILALRSPKRPPSIGASDLPARRTRNPATTMPDALSLLKALRYCWLPAFVTAVILAGVVCAAAWRILPPPRYTAFALLQIASKPPQVAFNILETRAETKDELDKYQKTQIELLKSRFVLNAALRDPLVVALPTVKEQDDPLEWLANELKVEFLNGSDLVKIALRGERANDVAVMVNAVMNAYLREVVTLEEGKRRRRMEQLQDVYDSYQAKLADKRQFFRNLAETAGSTDQKTLAYKQQLEMEHQASAEKELQECRAALRRARAELAVAESAPTAQPGQSDSQREARLNTLLGQDQRYRELDEAVARAQSKVNNFRRLARSANDAAIRTAQREFTAVVQRKEAYRRALMDSLEQQELGLRGDDRLVELRDRVAVLVRLEEAAAEEVKRFAARTTESNKTTLDLKSHEDEIAHLEVAAKKVGEDLEALKVELNAEQRITERERADVPRRREDKRVMLLGLTGTLTMFVVLLGFSWTEFYARRIESEEQVATSLGMNVMGALPAVPEGMKQPPDKLLPRTRQNQWNNLLVESIDAARTMILHASRDLGCRALMVTSAQRGEGKTSLSCHLAMSLARAGRRTLLIDCDLRKPSVHRAFNQPLERGFSELLRGEAVVEEVMRPLRTPGLTLITAGQCDSQSLQALVRNDIRAMLADLESEFDFIIVDSAPVLLVTDSLLMAQQVDTVVFSILRDVSRLPKVQLAYERLKSLGVRTLGAVVSGARVDIAAYGDYLGMSVLDANAQESK